MISLDTSVLARLVINDDTKQAYQAAQLIDSGSAFFVPLTVAMELEGVLRGIYKLDTVVIAGVFEALLSIRNVAFQNDADITAALAHYSQGMDFAGALHLITSSKCERMMTFDMKFAQAAKRLSNVNEVKLIVS
jgi:predicted nucleic-acid-binding protein